VAKKNPLRKTRHARAESVEWRAAGSVGSSPSGVVNRAAGAARSCARTATLPDLPPRRTDATFEIRVPTNGSGSAVSAHRSCSLGLVGHFQGHDSSIAIDTDNASAVVPNELYSPLPVRSERWSYINSIHVLYAAAEKGPRRVRGQSLGKYFRSANPRVEKGRRTDRYRAMIAQRGSEVRKNQKRRDPGAFGSRVTELHGAGRAPPNLANGDKMASDMRGFHILAHHVLASLAARILRSETSCMNRRALHLAQLS